MEYVADDNKRSESDKAVTLKTDDVAVFPGLFKVGLGILLLLGLAGLGWLIMFLHNRVDMNNEVESVLIPQPFTENNDFMFFHLPNQMRVLLVRPNAGLNYTYIC